MTNVTQSVLPRSKVFTRPANVAYSDRFEKLLEAKTMKSMIHSETDTRNTLSNQEGDFLVVLMLLSINFTSVRQ